MLIREYRLPRASHIRRLNPGVEDQIVYVAMYPDRSQRSYTPAEFAAKFDWKNDPEKAELLGK
ncbi:MAG: hypothetical protein NT013_08195 [Planctomycetia bacterium]|nr:hypothetical protein [Planctomycetia bacterium]